MKYRGFDIFVPAYMVPKKRKNRIGEEWGDPVPYVMIRANGTYFLDIESESGISIRLNNFIEKHPIRDKETKKVKEIVPSGLEKMLEIYQNALEKFLNKQKSYAEELSKEGGFIAEIQEVQAKLSSIDEELGLNKEAA